MLEKIAENFENPDTLVCLVKMVRVVARTLQVQVREQLAGMVKIVASRCEARQGESCLGVLATMAV